MCLNLKGYRDRAFRGYRHYSVRIFLWVWMKREIYKRKLDTRDEFLARILDAAAGIKNREDQLTRTTRDLRNGIAECTEVDGGILDRVL